ncbi:Leucine-rich repeat [Cinnamomum micranthum f. kanehirae]|uniref:Leucine-rich repeat n=1 Tax=Cinnamomum micranthum f. kanehirae TaxID=337451 RepID=A0A443NBJ4_9MAGN|nr:Leucine-rich repeat [Cinnamomum micranthum f. kanehirae]
MEQMQVNTMHVAGGNNPMVQGDIKADTGATINLGTQVTITVSERQKRDTDTAISHIVQVALDKAISCLQIGFELFCGAENRLVKIRDSKVDIHDFIVIAEQSPIKDPKLMKLLEELKDVDYDAEDLLEEYAIEEKRRSEEAENRTNKIRRIVTSLVTITPVIKLRELSHRLEDIKAECRKKREGGDLQEPGIEGDEDYELVPQYDYNGAILDGQNEDV